MFAAAGEYSPPYPVAYPTPFPHPSLYIYLSISIGKEYRAVVNLLIASVLRCLQAKQTTANSRKQPCRVIVSLNLTLDPITRASG